MESAARGCVHISTLIAVVFSLAIPVYCIPAGLIALIDHLLAPATDIGDSVLDGAMAGNRRPSFYPLGCAQFRG